MKIKILAVIAVLMLLLTFNVSAANYEYTISPGLDFTSASRGDDLTEISQKLNMTADELNTYFNKNGLLYLAVSDDTKTQIRLAAFTDNFSSAVDDISYLNDEQLGEFMSAVSDDEESTCTIVVNNGRKYIMVKDTLKDSGGVYTVTQYITICSGQTFYLSCYNQGETTSAEIQSIFKTLSLNTVNKEKENHFDFTNIIIIVGIVLFSAISVVMIIGIIKSVCKKNNFNKNSGENNDC